MTKRHHAIQPTDRRRQLKVRRWAAPFASALIIFILVAQLIVSIPLYPLANHLRRTWPFLDYPMYSPPHYEGDAIPRPTLVGITSEARELEIRPEDLGVGYWQYIVYLRAVQQADHATVRAMVRSYQVRQNVHLSALRLENRRLLLANGKVIPAPVEIVVDSPLDPAPEDEVHP